MINLIALSFITGLTTGGLSCLAVQGGLLASATTNHDQNGKVTIFFLISKLVAYTILGGLLGAFGSLFNISLETQAALQLVVGLFMIATALRLLNVHPIFNFTALQPPVLLLRYLKKESQKENFFKPIALGLLTVLIPCGVTQSMMILAISSGSFINGLAIMFFFTLGTVPIFLALGLSIETFFKNKLLIRVAATSILAIGLMAVNNTLVLIGSKHTFQNYVAVITESIYPNIGQNAKLVNGFQEATITVNNYGYKSNVKNIKIGIPVKLKIESNNVQSCARSFAIPSLKINKLLPVTGTEVIEFTPTKLGILTYSCSMGMYTGSFNVID